MKTLTLIPAYGRDYHTALAARADWAEGKDFKVQDVSYAFPGTYCSIRNSGMMLQDGYTHVSIRFSRLEKQTLVPLTVEAAA